MAPWLQQAFSECPNPIAPGALKAVENIATLKARAAALGIPTLYVNDQPAVATGPFTEPNASAENNAQGMLGHLTIRASQAEKHRRAVVQPPNAQMVACARAGPHLVAARARTSATSASVSKRLPEVKGLPPPRPR
jgi:hypothetical protein